VDADDGVLAVRLRTREGAIAEAVRRLDRVGVPIADVNLRRPTLDDVFLTLTGRAAEEDRTRDAEPAEEVAA
jgi:ABC-2 type transport system ATP-binding protein